MKIILFCGTIILGLWLPEQSGLAQMHTSPGYLANPIVSGLLILLILGGLFFELHTPGTIIPGLIAAVSALLFFAPLYVAGLAEGWEILLFFVGVALVILEVYVIPGVGIAGILGVLLIISGLGTSLIGNVGLDFPSLDHFGTAIWTLAVSLLLSILLIISLARYLPQSPRFSRLILKDWSAGEGEYIEASTEERLLGKEGETITTLRPSGTVRIGGNQLNVISRGEYIPKGERVRVTEVAGNKIVVIRISPENDTDDHT